MERPTRQKIRELESQLIEKQARIGLLESEKQKMKQDMSREEEGRKRAREVTQAVYRCFIPARPETGHGRPDVRWTDPEYQKEQERKEARWEASLDHTSVNARSLRQGLLAIMDALAGEGAPSAGLFL